MSQFNSFHLFVFIFLNYFLPRTLTTGSDITEGNKNHVLKASQSDEDLKLQNSIEKGKFDKDILNPSVQDDIDTFKIEDNLSQRFLTGENVDGNVDDSNIPPNYYKGEPQSNSMDSDIDPQDANNLTLEENTLQPSSNEQVDKSTTNIPDEVSENQYFFSIFGLNFSTYIHFGLYMFALVITFGFSHKILTRDPTSNSCADNCGESKDIKSETEKLKKEIEEQRFQAEKWSKLCNEAKQIYEGHQKTLEKIHEDRGMQERLNKDAEQEMECIMLECSSLENKIKEYNEELKIQQEKIERCSKAGKIVDKKKEEIEKQIKRYESEITETSGILGKIEKELKDVEKQLVESDNRKKDHKMEEDKLCNDIIEKKKEIEISNKLSEVFLSYDKEFHTLKDANDNDGVIQLMQKIADDFSLAKTEDAIKEMQQEIDAMKKALELEKGKGKVYQTELKKLTLEEQNLKVACAKWEADIERVVSDRKMLEKLVEEKEKECSKAKDEEATRKTEQLKKEQETKELEVLKTAYMKDIEDLKNEIKEMGVQHRQKIAAIDKKTHEYWQSCLKNEKEITQSKADIAYYKSKIAEMEKKYDEARSAMEDLTNATSPILGRPSRPNFQPDLRFPPMMPPLPPRMPPPPFLPPPPFMFPRRSPAPPFEWDELSPQQRQQPRNKERDN